MGKTVRIAPGGRSKVRSKKHSTRREYGRILLLGVAAALVVKIFFIQAYRIPSRSMEDSLLLGDCLLVARYAYGAPIPFTGARLPGLGRPEPGDIVVFRYPRDPARVFVKRCIATAGQKVEIRDKVVYVDGRRVADPPFSKYVDVHILPAAQNARDNYGPQRVPEGALFVLGDNRDNSRDSRHWGFLPLDLVLGKVLCVYWSCAPDYDEDNWLRQAASLPQRIRWTRIGDFVQ